MFSTTKVGSSKQHLKSVHAKIKTNQEECVYFLLAAHTRQHSRATLDDLLSSNWPRIPQRRTEVAWELKVCDTLWRPAHYDFREKVNYKTGELDIQKYLAR